MTDVTWLANDTITRSHAVRAQHLPSQWGDGSMLVDTVCKPGRVADGIFLLPADRVLGDQPPRCRNCERILAQVGREAVDVASLSTSDAIQAVVAAARRLREAARSMTWNDVAWAELTALIVAVDKLDGESR